MAHSMKGGRLRVNLLLLFGSLLLILAVSEVFLRTVGSFVDEGKLRHLISSRDLISRGYPGARHPHLGYAPRPGFSGTKNVWGTVVTILENGIRSSGPDAAPSDGPVILAVGDSFTFGDEVSDSETWPAVLERISGARVLNAGVFGYGLDQAVLRADMLMRELRPDVLLMGMLYPSDIERTEYDMAYGIPKPYFVVEDGALSLRNLPVPRWPAEADLFR